jgi:hypothetical protein
VLLAFLFETLEACGLFVNRTAICLQDELWRRGGTDHFGEPPEMGRAPGGPAGVAAIVSEQAGLEAKLGVLEIAEGICTGPSAITNGFIFNLGTETPVRSPERASLASCTASRRSVLTRSPAFLGISDGATTQQSWPCFVRYRESQEPQGPAS